MDKQFLMLCDETGMMDLKSVFREGTIQFLEVQGLSLNTDNKLNLLVTPVLPPVPPAFAALPTGAPAEPEQPPQEPVNA